MTPAEFRARLDVLMEVIFRGLTYYAVWKKLRFHEDDKVSWSLEEQTAVGGRFNGFFTPVILALGYMMLMQFAKIFDQRRKTVSLTNLLRSAQQDPGLVPRTTPEKVHEISNQLQENKKALDALKRRRDQWLAHAYPNPAPHGPLLMGEFDKLVKGVKAAFGSVSSAHDGQAVAWQLDEADWHTTRVVEILLEDIRRSESRSSR